VSLVAQGTTIFFSSHQIGEVEQVTDHVLMIDRGKLVLDAPMDRLKKQYRHIQGVFTDSIEERDLRQELMAWRRTEDTSHIESLATRLNVVRQENGRKQQIVDRYRLQD
jgi:ABC-type multidrug transport system ATPase subunit